MTLYHVLAFVTIPLAVYYAHQDEVAMTLLYCCMLNWLKERIFREEDGDTNG